MVAVGPAQSSEIASASSGSPTTRTWNGRSASRRTASRSISFSSCHSSGSLRHLSSRFDQQVARAARAPARRPATRTRGNSIARCVRPAASVASARERLDEVHGDRERAVGRRLDRQAHAGAALGSRSHPGRARSRRPGEARRGSARRERRIGRDDPQSAAATRARHVAVSASSRARPSAANDGTGSKPLAEPGGPGRGRQAAPLELAIVRPLEEPVHVVEREGGTRPSLRRREAQQQRVRLVRRSRAARRTARCTGATGSSSRRGPDRPDANAVFGPELRPLEAQADAAQRRGQLGPWRFSAVPCPAPRAPASGVALEERQQPLAEGAEPPAARAQRRRRRSLGVAGRPRRAATTRPIASGPAGDLARQGRQHSEADARGQRPRRDRAAGRSSRARTPAAASDGQPSSANGIIARVGTRKLPSGGNEQQQRSENGLTFMLNSEREEHAREHARAAAAAPCARGPAPPQHEQRTERAC